jgi:hypothetical protein
MICIKDILPRITRIDTNRFNHTHAYFSFVSIRVIRGNKMRNNQQECATQKHYLPSPLLQSHYLFFTVARTITIHPTTNWKAPADVSEKQMPFENTTIAAQKGKELYNVYCWSCHGSTGHGDGAAGGALGQKPC